MTKSSRSEALELLAEVNASHAGQIDLGASDEQTERARRADIDSFLGALGWTLEELTA